MVCVLTPVHVTPSSEMEPTIRSPMRSQRTQYGSGDGAVPLTVLEARAPVSTRYSTVTGAADAALRVTGMLAVPTPSDPAALDDGKPTEIAGDSSSFK